MSEHPILYDIIGGSLMISFSNGYYLSLKLYFLMRLMKSVVSLRHDFCCCAIGQRILSM